MKRIVGIFALVAIVALPCTLEARCNKKEVKKFKKIDRNNDGKIGYAETKGNPKLRNNFARIDRNNNKYIDLREFKAVI